ncbi:hypothetical protein ACLQ25_14170 [Micromonospora sp. DT44]|uniref:hypothetical protein n=1 Tax=Micromonospora sp. DT44 TaxID=3393439 RepID=UPI003CFAF3B6
MLSYLAVVLLTLAGAWADARGFVWADRIWLDGRLSPRPLVITSLVYLLGQAAYVLTLRFLAQIRDVNVALQATGWSILTFAFVAVADGAVANWQWTDRMLLLGGVSCLVALFYRTS